MNDRSEEHEDATVKSFDETVQHYASLDRELTEADKEKAHDELLASVMRDMPGFSIVKGQIKVRDVKKAVHSLSRTIVSDRIQIAAMDEQIRRLHEHVKQVQNAFQSLARNDVLMQTIAANVIYEIHGRGDQWAESAQAFFSMKEVDESTVGAVRLEVTKNKDFKIHAQDIEDGEVVYREIPRKFLDGVGFHAIQAYILKQDVRIPKGECIYVLFDGSDEMINLIPEDYVSVDEELESAQEDIDKTTQLYEETAVTQHSRVQGGEIQNLADELFPEGVDQDGDPVDLDLVEASNNASVRKMNE